MNVLINILEEVTIHARYKDSFVFEEITTQKISCYSF